MASLFSSLQTASTALDVYSRALGNEEANVSNSSTEGYAALRSRIAAIGPYGPPAGTDDYISLTSAGDLRSDSQVRAASSQAAASQTLADQLTPLVGQFDITGSTGILSAFQKFSSAAAGLSLSPNDQGLQSGLIAAASSVAGAFNKATAQLGTQRAAADSDIADTVTRVNQLTFQIRQYNVQVRGGASVESGVDAGLRSSVDELSSLVDISVSANADGTLSVLAGSRQPLVLGDQVYTLSVDPNLTPGQQVVSSGGGGSAASYGGKLGALLDFRNQAVTDLLGGNGVSGKLNDLAQGFATRVNSILTSGTTGTGAAGAPLFTWDGTNAAHTLAVDPAFTPSQLATGDGTTSNGAADSLAKLISSRNAADRINGLSAQDYFSSIAASVGRQLSDARAAADSGQTALTAAQSARQAKSGVSLDQEAVSITAYQRAYQANAKVISIINELTGDVVDLIK